VNWLFIHHNFPGQYLHTLQRLAASGTERVVFLSQPSDYRIEGVHRVVYRPDRESSPGVHPDAAEFEAAAIRATSVARACRELARTGFRPDIVVGHNGWGELLNLRDVWPDVPVLGYFEFFYRTEGADVGFDPEFPISEEDQSRVRAKNAVNLLGLEVADAGQTPTTWQRQTYPERVRPQLRIVPEGVDLERCRPGTGASFRLPGGVVVGGDKAPLLTYVARNLEPYRGFHILMRALPALLRRRPDLHVALIGGEGVSYGRRPEGFAGWREAMFDEVGSGLDPDRVHFLGHVCYDDHLALLQTSSVHVYLTYPFVASWSLREALSCGTALVCSDTAPVREFVSHRENGLLVPFHDPAAVARGVEELLDDSRLAGQLRANARRRAEAELGMDAHHASFDAAVRAVMCVRGHDAPRTGDFNRPDWIAGAKHGNSLKGQLHA
jgi:glycosyltransferase involved in cell wall biosynthesis